MRPIALGRGQRDAEGTDRDERGEKEEDQGCDGVAVGVGA